MGNWCELRVRNVVSKTDARGFTLTAEKRRWRRRRNGSRLKRSRSRTRRNNRRRRRRVEIDSNKTARKREDKLVDQVR